MDWCCAFVHEKWTKLLSASKGLSSIMVLAMVEEELFISLLDGLVWFCSLEGVIAPVASYWYPWVPLAAPV